MDPTYLLVDTSGQSLGLFGQAGIYHQGRDSAAMLFPKEMSRLQEWRCICRFNILKQLFNRYLLCSTLRSTLCLMSSYILGQSPEAHCANLHFQPAGSDFKQLAPAEAFVLRSNAWPCRETFPLHEQCTGTRLGQAASRSIELDNAEGLCTYQFDD